jgi:para-nitrobenzyl esterase
VDSTTDLLFTCPARRIARTVKAAQTQPVRRYHYSHIRPYGPLAVMRAFHASELPYVFGTVSLGGYIPTSGDDDVSHAMQAYWSRFAANHDPNGAGLVDWPLYDATTDATLEIDDTVTAVDGIASAHCDYWDNLAP